MAINVDTLVLRETNNPPLTNKNDNIENVDYDENWIKAYDDFLSLAFSAYITTYNALTVYDSSTNPFASYNSRTWRWIDASSGSGVTPGTDPAKWVEIFPAYLAHERDKDTYLDKGGANEVTAADIASIIASGGTNLGSADLTSVDALRKYVLGGTLSADGLQIRDSLDAFNVAHFRGDGLTELNFGVGVGVAPSTSYALRSQSSSGSGALNTVSSVSNTIVSTNSNSNGVNINVTTSGTGLPTGVKSQITSNAALKKCFEAVTLGTGTNVGYFANVQGGSNNYAFEIQNGDIKVPSGIGYTGTLNFNAPNSGDTASMTFDRGILVSSTQTP